MSGLLSGRLRDTTAAHQWQGHFSEADCLHKGMSGLEVSETAICGDIGKISHQ